MRWSILSAKVAMLLGSFVVAFAVVQIWITPLDADHGVGAGTINTTCGDDGEYYHVHWERTGSGVNVYYELQIINESGATGEYQNQVDDSVSDWNSGQNYVTLIQDNFSTTDVLVRVHRFGTAYNGLVTLDPNQCTYPYSDESTHAEFEGNTTVWINSQEIEVASDPDHARAWTVPHEIGHLLGLGHDNDSTTGRVMYHEYGSSRPTSPQSGDLNQLSTEFDPYGHTD